VTLAEQVARHCGAHDPGAERGFIGWLVPARGFDKR
jgi:hypothetical protein